MPEQPAHLKAVEDNLAAYAAIPADYPNWRAVVLFYAAVHLVEALAASENVHHREHADRQAFVKKHHRQIWAPYMRLKSESLKARYLTAKRGPNPTLAVGAFALSAQQVETELRNNAYSAIDSYVQKILETKAALASARPRTS